MEKDFSRSGVYDRRNAFARLLSLALYCFYPCYGENLSGKLAEGADRIVRTNVYFVGELCEKGASSYFESAP